MAAQKYDPAILQKFAAGLYSRASSIEATYLIGGLLLGAAAPFLFSPLWVSIALLLGGITPGAAAGLGAIVGGLVGFVAGRNKAFKLRLEAQLVLCQVAIEENTRDVAIAAGTNR